MPNSAAPTRTNRPGGKWLILAGAGLLALLAAAPGRTEPAPDLADLRARAEQDDVEAQNTLGNAYTNGFLGLKPDPAEAYKWYAKAAARGFAPAEFNLGLANELGRGVPADASQAFKYYLLAAEQGYATAQFNVGNMYATGRGVGPDLFEANVWYRQAAEKGIVEAEFNLGLAYEAGRGVKQDAVEAARWYQIAADRGFARARHNLGLLYEDGRGVATDEAKAATLYRAAAEQGFAPAENNYGVMLSEGRGGLAKDPVQAFVWLSLAVDNGSPATARDALAASLNPDQLAAANRLLEQRRGGNTPLVTAQAAPPPASVRTAESAAPATSSDLAAALEKARGANAALAEANQRLELEKARREQERNQGGDPAKLIEQLRGQSQRLAAQVQALTTDKETADRDAAVLKAQIKDFQDEAARQKTGGPAASSADGAQLQAEVARLTSRLEQAAASLSQAQQANQALTDDKARLQREMESQAAGRTGAGGAAPDADQGPVIANLQRDNARLNDEVKRSTIELLSLNQQLRSLRSQPANAGEAPAADAGADAVAAQLRDARDEITRLNAEAARLRAAVPAAEAATTQVGQLTARVQELETQLQQAPGRPVAAADDGAAVARLQEQVRSLQNEKNELEKWSQSLEKSINEKSAAAQADQQGAAESRRQLAQQQKQLDDDKAALGTQQQKIRDLSAENTSLGERAAKAEQALATEAGAKAKAGENQHLRQELAAVQQQAAKLAEDAGQVADLKKQVADVSQALDKSSGSVAELTAANDRLEQALAAAKKGAADSAARQEELEKLRNAAADTAVLREENARLQQAAAGGTEAQQQLTQLKKQLDDATAALSAQERQTHELGVANRDLTDRATKAEQAIAAGQAAESTQLTDLKRQAAAAQERAEKLARDAAAVNELKKQLAEANQALDKSGHSVAELTAANDRLERAATAAKPGGQDTAALRGEIDRLRHAAEDATSLREENTQLRKAGESAAALRARNEQLVKDNAQVTAFMNSNRHDLDQAQARVTALEKQLADAKAAVPPAGDANAKPAAELADANQAIEKLNATVADLTATNDRLEKDLDNARKSTAAALAAQTQVASAAQPDAYKMEISTLQARVKELEGQAEDDRTNAAKEVATLASQLQRSRETNKALADANRALVGAKQAETPVVSQADFDQLQSRVKDLAAADDELKRENGTITEDNQKLTAERDELKQQLVDARQVATALPGLADEKAALQEHLEAVGAQLVKAQQDADTLQKANADATAQAAASKTAADKAAGDLAALQGRMAEAEKATDSQGASVAELTETNTKLESERNDLRRQLASLQADNARLNDGASNLQQLKADADRSAQQNIAALTAQLAQVRLDLQGARDANSRLTEANAVQERDRAATLAKLRQDNSALAARLGQAQGTLDQIAATARLGTPAATIASGGTVPVRPVTPPVAAADVRYHTVGEGDSLSKISMRYYGTPNRWQEIYQANRDLLAGSSSLRVGMQLRIP